MSISEIFSKLSTHMIQGMMVHEQLMTCYLFLGLKGYAKCHEYHYISETKGRIRLSSYYMEHFGSIIETGQVSDPAIIPQSWHKNVRESVGFENRKNAMHAAIEEWIKWEESTKFLYESCYKELMDMGAAAPAEFLKFYILDVDEELAFAKEQRLAKESVNYDIIFILDEQKDFEKKYSKLLKKC